jgi:trans-aconitate methyltransferase
MKKVSYDAAFYSAYESDSIGSARAILAVVNMLVSPKSVVDVGCGIGTWLKVWRDLGVENIVGIDGDYVNRRNLLIPAERFTPMNLAAPVKVEGAYDLVQSLEVGEHLPEQSSEAFVAFLCSLGPIVLFSAALPYQGGTDHINEQWPDFWAELFKKQGYVTVDAIRDRVWTNPDVAYYYAQNALLFVKAEVLDSLHPIIRQSVVSSLGTLSRVHPRRWLQTHENPPRLEQVVRAFPESVADFAARSGRKLSNFAKQHLRFSSAESKLTVLGRQNQ